MATVVAQMPNQPPQHLASNLDTHHNHERPHIMSTMFGALNRFISRLDAGPEEQQSATQGAYGFQVLRNANPEVPLDPWFDFIIGINGRTIVRGELLVKNSTRLKERTDWECRTTQIRTCLRLRYATVPARLSVWVSSAQRYEHCTILNIGILPSFPAAISHCLFRFLSYFLCPSHVSPYACYRHHLFNWTELQLGHVPWYTTALCGRASTWHHDTPPHHMILAVSILSPARERRKNFPFRSPRARVSSKNY